MLQSEIAAAIALGFAAALLVGLACILRARMRATVRRAALRELTLTRNLMDPQARLTAQARLLRRIVRTLAGEEAASAHGAAWVGALDKLFATDFFSHRAGHAFVDGLYRRPSVADPGAIDAELTRLFSRIKA